MDTDSFVLSVNTNDIIKDLKKILRICLISAILMAIVKNSVVKTKN